MKKIISTLLLILGGILISFAQENSDSLLAKEIILFPNPTSEIIFIQKGREISEYRLIDMQGKEVQKGYQHAQIISLIDLPSGVYIFEFKVGNYLERRRVQKN